MATPRRLTQTLLASALGAAVLGGSVSNASAAATTITLGAPTSAFAVATNSQGGIARADFSGPFGWPYTVPRNGVVTGVDAFMANPSPSATASVMAVDPTTRVIRAIGTPVNFTPPGALDTPVSIPATVDVRAGEVVGLQWTGFTIWFTTNTPTLGTHGYRTAATVAGDTLTLEPGGVNSMQVQYTVALVPLSTAAPLVSPTTPTVGVAVSGTDGAWDATPDSATRQWQRCDASGAACTAIAGATAASYVPTTADLGFTLRLSVTATNVAGPSAPADSAATAVVVSGIFPPPSSAPAATTATFFAPNDPPQPKVTLCHATASAGNPYVVITVAPEAVFMKGHDQHQNREDIIPPFAYVKSGKTLTYEGLNWDARGRAIYAAGCTTPQSTPQQQILDPPVKSRVTICHATASASNPYVVITVAPEAIFRQGHDQHQDRRDIIPPFAYDGGSYPGLNWDSEGREILGNGCEKPTPVVNPLEEPATNVTLCHRVGGPQYVRTTVAPQAALNGHGSNHGLDIIPPFTYLQGQREVTFPGRNWDVAGRALWSNGCVAPLSPQPIRPEVTCIAPQADGTFVAYFAYASDNVATRTVPIGAANVVTTDALSAGAVISGQPTSFAPGRVDAQLAVSGLVQAGSASWTITYDGVTTTAIATGESPRCPTPAQESPEVGVFTACVTPSANGTYSVTFGYQNDGVIPVSQAVGAGNYVALSGSSPGAQDRGQPTSFAPGRFPSAFTVAGVPRAAGITWTLTLASGSRQAYGSWQSPRCAGSPEEGLPLGLSVTCVQPNGDGTYDAVFGYANPNGVSIEVPAGPGNAVSVSPSGPGPESRGQPVQFQPGSQQAAFSVLSVPVGQEVTWTVAHNGTTTVTAGSSSTPRCRPDAPLPPGPTPPTPPDPEPLTPRLLPIGVYVECVQATATTYDATFGYVNPSSVAVSVPVGRRNAVTGGPDRGQPSTFAPGTVAAAFTVKGIRRTTSLRWRVVGPDGGVAQAVSSASGPNCQVDVPPEKPQILLDVTPPGDGPPRSVVDVDNPGPTSDERPEIIIPVPPGASPITVTPRTRGVRCRTVGSRIYCRARQALLPGRAIRVIVSGRRCGTSRTILGAVAVVGRPGPGLIAASSSARTPLGGCTAPVTG